MGKVRNNVLKSPLYGNCRMEDPSGIHIFNCDHKKAKWYLKRNLANIIQESPLIIRLTFEPAGRGHADDSFYLQQRENLCVSCGVTNNLTKHHVVPYCYRKHFPENFKNHISYDILPLCYECHDKYEVFALELKEQINSKFSIKTTVPGIDHDVKHACLSASAIIKHGDKIPKERYEYLLDVVRKYYKNIGKTDITADDIQNAANLTYIDNGTTRYGKLVVERLDSIEDFVKLWRKHFLDSLKPKFLPPHWIVERPL